MSTSGGTRSSSNATRAPSVGGGRSKAPVTHEEQIARAEANVAKARAKVDQTEAADRAATAAYAQASNSGSVSVDKVSDLHMASFNAGMIADSTRRQLQSAQTRLDNLRSGKGTPAYKHAQTMARVQAQIDRLQKRLEQMRQQGPRGTTGRAKSSAPRTGQGTQKAPLAPLPEMVGQNGRNGPLGDVRAQPFAPPNVRLMRGLYGDSQLERAISGYRIDSLRGVAKMMGLSKAGKSRAEVIHNLAQHLLRHESRADSIRRARATNDLLSHSRGDRSRESDKLAYGPPGEEV
jgi:hypothetical protein